MVKFTLVKETPEVLVYWYYPEGNTDQDHGVIVCNREMGRVEITKVAEEDYERDIPPEEMNELIAAMNQMIAELGEADFVEMETEPVHSVQYGDHAVHKIKELLAEGKIPKEGTVLWY